MTSLYERLIAAGCETDHHESDLYVKRTDTSKAILDEWLQEDSRRARPTVFRSEIDRTLWYDVPFMFDPFWNAKKGNIAP